MGIKRPLDDEELQELPFKNSRQFDYSNKMNQYADIVPHIQVEDGFHKYQWDKPFEGDAISPWDKPFEGDAKYQWDKPFEGDAINYVTNFLDKDFETSAPLSLVTSTSSDEDTGTGTASVSPVSPEYFDSAQLRTSSVVDDVYSLLLDRSPRRQVPLGPNHQASVPSWSGHLAKDKFVSNEASDTTANDNEKRLMGTCVIPMPGSDLSANNSDSDKVGAGRTDCICLDSGSLRCVRQHVMETREKLKKSLGHEKFVKLGFYDMGEDVAYKWTEEEEEIFRQVVYSNPVSLGKNFWKQLSLVFPSRSKRELVSYYFNVFILQRRAVQNRSSILEIDSDDDEWQGSKQTYEVQASEEDEDSDIDSLADQEDLANPEPPQVIEDDDDSGEGSSGATTEGYASHFFPEPHDEGRSDTVFQQTSKVSGIGEEFNVQDDSCMSFEFQPNLVDSHRLGDNKTNLHVSGVKSDLNKSFQQVKQGRSTSELDHHVYLYDSCDARIWDARYPTAPTKGIDLPSTSNIIEEIFGQDTCDNKMKNE